MPLAHVKHTHRMHDTLAQTRSLGAARCKHEACETTAGMSKPVSAPSKRPIQSAGIREFAQGAVHITLGKRPGRSGARLPAKSYTRSLARASPRQGTRSRFATVCEPGCATGLPRSDDAKIQKNCPVVGGHQDAHQKATARKDQGFTTRFGSSGRSYKRMR